MLYGSRKDATQSEKEENKGHFSSITPNGTTQNRQMDEGKHALGNQTDEGDQTDLNVAGDKPTQTSPDAMKSRDESIAHSNSTADHTNRSAYTTKGVEWILRVELVQAEMMMLKDRVIQ